MSARQAPTSSIDYTNECLLNVLHVHSFVAFLHTACWQSFYFVSLQNLLSPSPSVKMNSHSAQTFEDIWQKKKKTWRHSEDITSTYKARAVFHRYFVNIILSDKGIIQQVLGFSASDSTKIKIQIFNSCLRWSKVGKLLLLRVDSTR